MFDHIQTKLKERGLNYSELFLRAIAEKDCTCEDTAVILEVLKSPVPYKNDTESNGNLVILIVRHNYPVTIMFRRSNQPLNPGALNVKNIIWYRRD